jgi:hypothetical protein
MLDPSLLLSRRTWDEIEAELWSGKLAEGLAIPESFAEFASADVLPATVERYYGAYLRQPRVEGPRLRSWIAEAPNLRTFSAREVPDAGVDLRSQVVRVRLREPSAEINQILEDEWVFLQGQSWLASRTKKTFRSFIEAGGGAIEVGRDVFDAACAKTLKLDTPAALTQSARIRATLKWIGVGGASATVFVDPLAAFFGELVSGFFLLMDP